MAKEGGLVGYCNQQRGRGKVKKLFANGNDLMNARAPRVRGGGRR